MKNIFLALAFVLSLPYTITATAKESTTLRTVHVCNKHDTQSHILACNMYRESRGEGDKGMLAVGFTTVNRKDHPRFPKEINNIVYQRGQFEWTAKTGSFSVQDKARWESAVFLANFLIPLHDENKMVYDALDVTYGSVYFHEKSINPHWSKVMQRTVKIGNHIFYKDANKKPKGENK